MENKITANESLDSQLKRDRISSYIILFGSVPMAFFFTFAALLKTYDVIPLTVNYTIQGIMFVVFVSISLWAARKGIIERLSTVREIRFNGEFIFIETEKHRFGKSAPISSCRVRQSEIIITEGIGFISRKSLALLLNDGEETFTIILEFYPEGTKELILSNIQGK